MHGYALKSGLSLEVIIGNSLIKMYSKCGCLLGSLRIFEKMPRRDSISWSALFSAHGFHEQGEKALQLFQEMEQGGVDIDGITLLAVLSACNHAGFVNEGQWLFNDALKDGKVPLIMEHYACYVDLLGRSGKLQEVWDVINTMPMRPSNSIWSSFALSCKVHGRLPVAEMLGRQLIEVEPRNAANYTFLSMVYAEASDCIGMEEVRKVMKEGIKKKLRVQSN